MILHVRNQVPKYFWIWAFHSLLRRHLRGFGRGERARGCLGRGFYANDCGVIYGIGVVFFPLSFNKLNEALSGKVDKYSSIHPQLN